MTSYSDHVQYYRYRDIDRSRVIIVASMSDDEGSDFLDGQAEESSDEEGDSSSDDSEEEEEDGGTGMYLYSN